MGEWQQFLKFCQGLSAFTLGPAAQGESTPPEERNLPTKPALSACPVGVGTGLGLLSASLCRACTQPPEKPSVQLSSPPPAPVFQPLAFCGVDGFFPYPHPSLIFLGFTWTRASGKRSSWHPAFRLVLYLQQPNKMEKRTPHSGLLLGWWGYLLFRVFWMVVVILDL